MTLAGHRHQFLTSDTTVPDSLVLKSKGLNISKCICFLYYVTAIVAMFLVGVAVYGIKGWSCASFYSDIDVWDTAGADNSQIANLKDIMLPKHTTPSFYRIKLKPFPDNETFEGHVSIIIQTTIATRRITLHAKNLNITDVNLSEQIYRKVNSQNNHIFKRNIREINNTDPNSESTRTHDLKNDTFVQNSNSSNNPIDDQILHTTEVSNTPEESNTSEVSNTPVKNVTLDTNSSDTNNQTVIHNSTTNNIEAELVPKQVSRSEANSIKIVSAKLDISDERLVINIEDPIEPDVNYVLQISFTGNLTYGLNGLYKSFYNDSDGKGRDIVVTQFEPIYARKAFPCFDEPDFKAKFEISLASPDNMNALSNMPVSSVEEMAETPGWKWTHFQKSVQMSSYLVACAISNFESVNTSYVSSDNITKPIKIWARQSMIKKADYAAKITPILLRFYEDFFGIPYSLDKMDLIGIPDFLNSAMENWGLITFQEFALFVDEENSSPSNKMTVAQDIAHELAHQWFGNLVTMKWWTDIWLNEGFATYMEYIGGNYIEPGWNLLHSFTASKIQLMHMDQMKHTHAVSLVVDDVSLISQKFDEISYTKGACLIRMLNHTLNETVFHEGLIVYINQWKFSNADEDDLWSAMSQTAVMYNSLPVEISVNAFMKSWTRQVGFPLVTVVRNYNTNEVTMSQSLFSASYSPLPSVAAQKWYIPISYTNADHPMHLWSTTPREWLVDLGLSVNITINDSQPLYVNVGAIGFYRVNYDKKNWLLLKDKLSSNPESFPAETRAQLLDDALNIAKIGKLEYDVALDMLVYLSRGESSKLVWETALGNFEFLDTMLESTSYYGKFQDFTHHLVANELTDRGYGITKPKDDNDALVIENLLAWDCKAESPKCITWAKNIFAKWVNQTTLEPNPIPSHLRTAVYYNVLYWGGKDEFEFLWKAYEVLNDPNDKIAILTVLGATREEGLLTQLFEKSITDVPTQYIPMIWSGTFSTIGCKVSWDFIKTKWEYIYKKYSKIDPTILPNILESSRNQIKSEDELTEFKEFVHEHIDQLKEMKLIVQKILDAGAQRIEWNKRYLNTVGDWISNYYYSVINPSIDNHNTTVGGDFGNNTQTVENSTDINNVNLLGNDTLTT